MSAGHPQLARPAGRTHPAVLNRRLRELILVGLIAALPVVVGLAIMLLYSNPNPVLLFGGVAGIFGVALLLVSSRYELTLTLLMLYLGVLDGPIKLEAANVLASAIRDVLILAVALGMLMRLVVSRQRVSIPPLAAWVFAFVLFVLANALNPHTVDFLKALGGYRQELEWVPFFFFGYVILRDKERFRKFFLLLGVVALANGLVGAYQSRLSPHQLASWGPGYRELALGGNGNGITGRTYAVEGVAHVRPPALGSDAGFGGGVGALALPCMLALLAVGGAGRRKWPIVLLTAGPILGIASAASRTSVLVGLIALLSFGALSIFARLRLGRAFAGVIAVAVIAIVVGALLIAAAGRGVFARQESLTSAQRTEETGASGKEQSLSEIPTDLEHEPFGFGLGITGAASGFGGRSPARFEGARVAGGSAYNLLIEEVGAPGLLLWLGLTISTIVLAMRGLRRVPDLELRTYLVGLLSAYVAVTAEGFSGPTLAVTIGAFLWFVPGVFAYWFGRLRRVRAPTVARPAGPTPSLAGAL